METSVFEPGALTLQSFAGDYFFATGTFTRDVLFEDFEIRPGVVIPEGDYSFQSARFSIFTSHNRPVRWSLSGVLGEFFNGDRFQLSPSVIWRPSRHFRLQTGFSYNQIDLPAGEFETVVGSASFHVAPNTRLSWSTTTQWDNFSDRIRINSRIRWILKPGQDVFFVANQVFAEEDGRFRSTHTEAVSKVGMTFRF